MPRQTAVEIEFSTEDLHSQESENDHEEEEEDQQRKDRLDRVEKRSHQVR